MCPSAGGHSDGIFRTWLLATAARKRWVEGCLADDAAAGECVFRKRSSQFAVTTPLRGCAVNRADNELCQEVCTGQETWGAEVLLQIG